LSAKGIVVPAIGLAKTKTVFQIIMIDAWFLFLVCDWFWLHWLAVSAGVIGVYFAMHSAWQYWQKFWLQFSRQKKPLLTIVGSLGLLGFWPLLPNTMALALALLFWWLTKAYWALLFANQLLYWLLLLLAVGVGIYSLAGRWTRTGLAQRYFVAGKLMVVLLLGWNFWRLSQGFWSNFWPYLLAYVLVDAIFGWFKARRMSPMTTKDLYLLDVLISFFFLMLSAL
jgi:hypothetical protein